MICLKQHVPMFVNDGEGGWKCEAASLAELLALPEVAIYAEDTEPVEREGTVYGAVASGERRTVTIIHDAPDEKRFYRFSRSDNHLMVEHNNGDYWWVVGTLRADDPRELDALPVWKPPAEGERRVAAWNRGETGPQKGYRCKEHGVRDALCCLPRWTKEESAELAKFKSFDDYAESTKRR